MKPGDDRCGDGVVRSNSQRNVAMACPATGEITVMDAGGSYIAEDDFDRLEDEVVRLGEQIRLSWPREREVLARLPVQRDGVLLDIGCGPGFALERLAQMYPQARFTGIDPSPTFLSIAEARLNRQFGSRIRLVQGRFGHETGLGGPYDFALCRYVLQHLQNPLHALYELHAALRPGGYSAVIEVDAGLLGVSDPFQPELLDIYRKAGRVQARRGGNRCIARKLVRLMQAAGFEDVRMDALVLHSDEYGLDMFDHQLSPDTLRPALDKGAITRDEFAAIQAAHAKFCTNPDAVLMSLVFVCTGRRPVNDSNYTRD